MREAPALAWALLTNVRFAVVQICVLVVAGLIGTLVRQIPSFALHDPAAYAREMADLHRRYDGLSLLGWQFGPAMTDLFERIGFFRVFSTPWFFTLATILAISIVFCTLDRLPRLWRDVRRVRVVQPEAYFAPSLPRRAVVGGATPDAEGRGGEGVLEAAAVREVLQARRYRVRVEEAGGIAYLYGDRNRFHRLWTLLTHTGLVLFLVAGAITGWLGYETAVFLADGQSAPVQPVGTPDNLLVKNLGFSAPRRPDGSFEDFWSDLVVYRGGVEVARKRIRVNDPLTVDGFTFHQNSFGPAAELEIRDGAGALLWLGPVLLSEQALGLPSGTIGIPGTETGLQVVLAKDEQGAPYLGLIGYRADPATGSADLLFFGNLPRERWTDPATFGGLRIRWSRVTAYTGLVIRNDPGAPIVLIAFLSLIGGLTLTFYLPRRRVWTRLESGRLALVARADRYVNVEHELAELLAALRERAGVTASPTHG